MSIRQYNNQKSLSAPVAGNHVRPRDPGAGTRCVRIAFSSRSRHRKYEPKEKMLDISLERNLGRFQNAVRRNAWPIAILAAAIGWILVSRMDSPRGLAKRVRTARRSLRQRVDHNGDDLHTTQHQVARKKLLTSEPMAGYGA
jgi:hypothetical protein